MDSLEKYAYYFDELNVSYQVVDCETTELSSQLIIVPRAVLPHYLQLSGTPVVYSVAVDEAERWSASQFAQICDTYVSGKENTVRVPPKYFFACNAVCVDPENIVASDLPKRIGN